MPTGSRKFDLRRAFTRSVDSALLLILLAGGFLALEFLVRPFYVPAPVLRAPQVRFVHSADFGWVMAPDSAAHSLDRDAPIGLDGFRVMPAPEAATARWVLLGGGNAFGVGVDAGETFFDRAARTLRPGALRIDAACEGYDLFQSVRLFDREAAVLDPDLLIVTVEPEDLPEGGTVDTLFTAERFAKRAPVLNRTPSPDTPWETLKRKSRLVNVLDARVRAFLRIGRTAPAPVRAGVRPIDLLIGRDTAAIREAWSGIDREFAALERDAARAGCRVLVIVLPFPDQVRRAYPRARWQTGMADLCAAHGFLMVDPLDEMARAAREDHDRLYLPRLPFLSAAGHAAVARAIASTLRGDGTPAGAGEP